MASGHDNAGRVFLCHSAHDKAAVRDLYHRLRNDGVNPWLDEEDLIPGQDWHVEIETAVRSSAIVIVLMTSGSIAKSGFVNREIRFALDVADEQPEGSIFVIPAKLEQCELPTRLRRWHSVNLYEQTGYDKLLKALRVKGLVPAAREQQPQPEGPTKAVAPGNSSSAVIPAAGGAGEEINPKDGLAYVWIPPGRFRMGLSEGDTEGRPNEEPAQEVELSRGFWLGKTPVTQAAYRKVTGQSPSYFKGDDRPVEQVSWDEAQAYCKAVGGRLPTEAEWEYAARAGSSAARYGLLDEIDWHDGNSGGETHPVGKKKPNGFGLRDMLGNVWEWTGDWYADDYYGRGENKDPQGPSSGTQRVLRGGSWYSLPSDVRASDRVWG